MVDTDVVKPLLNAQCFASSCKMDNDSSRDSCSYFMSPAEATGGLEAWRLGGYIKKTIKNHKMDTEAAQMMPKSSQN